MFTYKTSEKMNQSPQKIPNLKITLATLLLLVLNFSLEAQITNASRSGFTWITKETITDLNYGSGYSMYTAAWPILKDYPGPQGFQMGLGSSWLTTQRTGNEPEDFYTTIEGGIGWWHDTRFGTKTPKYIMGGVSYNFYAWANGPGAGKTQMLPNGQRDWSTAGGKYGVAQLSNKLLWAPDGLNLAQSLNGELLGYGYTPLPLTDPMTETNGLAIETGNQCWTLFLNTTNFKGPASFFLPTFWTEPVLEDFSLEGLFLDSRPSDPNIPLGLEHAGSPALISFDNEGNPYAKLERLQFPANSGTNNMMLLNQFSVYNENAFWNSMENWFNGGDAVQPGINSLATYNASFAQNGGSTYGKIAETSSNGLDHTIDLNYIDNTQLNGSIMGFEFDLETVYQEEDNFLLPEYFKLDEENTWQAIKESTVPASTNLTTTEVPSSVSQITYLTPLDPECQFQDPEGPWNNPGPSAGPFYAAMEDGSTLTYYWYRFIDQPAIVHANLPDEMRENLQSRVELIHSNWSHTDTFIADPEIGSIATLDPNGIVTPPAGFEIGYVPIVTKQAKTEPKVRVFILAGQSNMEGFGTIEDTENDPGSLIDVIENDSLNVWPEMGEVGNWNSLEGAYLYFANNGDTIETNVTVGQGNSPNLIGAELMFAHQLDSYYEDPILLIKTAWGGKNLAEDFRPPSADGATGAYYNSMIQTIQEVTQNIDTKFPDLGTSSFEISGFTWFQGWNDGASDAFLNEYESNLYHLVNDVRTDLEQPDLPFVIANSGHGGYEIINDGWVQSMQNIISVAQENVGCNDALYGGKIGFVDTKKYYINASESPSNAIYHYNNNARSYLNIGKSMGNEMIKALNDMAFCYEDCGDQIDPGILSIGNRVWNDYNMNGMNEPNEPGIPGVSVLIWADSDGDSIPDWQGFGGIQITDEEGYYNFTGLAPGNYSVFIWQVDNWGEGEPLEGFQSTNNFISNANNDQDFDNNGFGNSFTDIMSGIVSLNPGEEPLEDGDPFDCYFNYDANGNNSVDFGFFNPNASGCMDSTALNFNLSAVTEDGSCEYLCDENFNTVVLEFTSDSYSEETTWNLVSQSGETLYNGTFSLDTILYTESVCVPKDEVITFNVFDSYGDGMCCGHGNGQFSLYLCGEQVISGGEFEYVFSAEFYNCEQVDNFYNCQEIVLPLGWSIFSTFILPENPSIDTVLAPIVNELIIVKDNIGNAYLPDYLFNGIGLMDIGQAYQIKTTESLSIEICGTSLKPEEHPINLTAGWNMIGYLRTEGAPIDLVLADLNFAENLIIAKDYIGNAYLPEWNFNGIGDMIPGRGYSIKVTTNDVVHFLSNSEDY